MSSNDPARVERIIAAIVFSIRLDGYWERQDLLSEFLAAAWPTELALKQ
jgi:hypothetical protein